MKKDTAYKDRLVYQVSVLEPGSFNYTVIASSLNKQISKATYKSLLNEGKDCKLETINHKGQVINGEC
jgi:hypothetical protein